MKIKVTKKEILKGYKNIICVGYCDIQHLLLKEANYYTCGVYGWNADIYEIDYNTCIVTGYRPFGNIHASYQEITKKYDEKARKIYEDKKIKKYETKKAKIEKLLQEFVKEALSNEE